MRPGISNITLLLCGPLWASVACAQRAAEPSTPADAASSPAASYTTFEHIEYNVERAACTGPETGEVTVTLYHRYPSSLHNLRLQGTSNVADVRVEPPAVQEFKPTLFQSFTVHVSPTQPPETDRIVIPLNIHADEFSGEASIEVTVPLTEDAEREVNAALCVPVGEVEVRVTPYGNLVYLAYIAACLAIIGWVIVRARRAG
jgi:hypothetical protein